MQITSAQRLLIEALSMPRKKSVEAKVKERVKQGKCLLCDRDYVSRGLCHTHRQLFYTAMRRQESKEARVAFESEMIAQGNILAEQEQREWTTKNPFLRSAS